MSWIESISNGIKKIFSATRPALPSIPPILLLCELKNRPGLSAIALTTSIIRRLSEAGIVTEQNVDGSDNKINQFVRIFVEELIKEFKDNAVVSTVNSPGEIMSFGTGVVTGGSVVVNSVNTNVSQGMGLVR